ncbi:uncharacterized protein L199_008071 [Kwoniella botswanensis]|uniref:uncharacterized protein n=1 Tax=Kwoniella botswanensis TaxID=1268659 RepID=UPI00315DEFB9
MQTEPHHTNGGASPLPPPSPTLTTSFRHQPGPNTADPPSSSSIRHRTPYTHSDNNDEAGPSGTVRISIQTPFGDLGGTRSRRKEGWPLSLTKTISSIKDDLVHGRLEGAGTWEKEGMRVVYHGRIVRDNETLQDIIGKIDPEHVYVLHLVARRIPVTPLPTSGIMHQNLSEFPLPPQQTINHVNSAIPSTPFLSPSLPSATSTNSLALGDTIHYLLFTSRHHLLNLLGMAPLKWDEMIPRPTMTQEKASEAIMSVIRVFATSRESREEGWENWQIAFEGDTEDDMKNVWEQRKRDGVERDIRALWATATGRKMSEGGDKVQVEVDGTIYTLQLPALSQLTASQLIHLFIYLRITTLLPLIEPIYHQSLIPPPTPTRTQIQHTPTLPGRTQDSGQGQRPNRRVIYRRTFNIRIPYIPLSVLPHLFWSALKMTAMVWMMTRGMKWNDNRFWVIVGLASGWWIIDALSNIGRVTREIRAGNRERQAQAGNENQNQNQQQQNQAQPQAQEQNVPGPAVNVQDQNPPANVNLNVNGANRQPNLARISRSTVTSWIARFHLSTDSRQLRLPPSNLNGDGQIPLLPEPRSRPSRIQTQLILPILLWFITLVPEWESLRGRAIRRRERGMRVVVGENQRQAQAQAAQQDQPEGEGVDEEGRRRRDILANLPTGLSVPARKYYLRVVDRGEGIDWEEEREAQRALGVGEEDGNGNGNGGGDDEGMRMRML